MTDTASPLPVCVVCGGRTLTKAWLPLEHGSAFDCITCGPYAMESELSAYLHAERLKGNAAVLKLLPGLQRTITAKRLEGEKVPYFARCGWDAEAREYL